MTSSHGDHAHRVKQALDPQQMNTYRPACGRARPVKTALSEANTRHPSQETTSNSSSVRHLSCPANHGCTAHAVLAGAVSYLVRDALVVVVQGLDLSRHFRELEPDELVLDEGFTERLP